MLPCQQLNGEIPKIISEMALFQTFYLEERMNPHLNKLSFLVNFHFLTFSSPYKKNKYFMYNSNDNNKILRNPDVEVHQNPEPKRHNYN